MLSLTILQRFCFDLNFLAKYLHSYLGLFRWNLWAGIDFLATVVIFKDDFAICFMLVLLVFDWGAFRMLIGITAIFENKIFRLADIINVQALRFFKVIAKLYFCFVDSSFTI